MQLNQKGKLSRFWCSDSRLQTRVLSKKKRVENIVARWAEKKKTFVRPCHHSFQTEKLFEPKKRNSSNE